MARNMDTFGSDDMSVPELKLVQNTGGETIKAAGGKPGDLYLTLSNEIFKGDKGMAIVVVDIAKNRTYWGRTEITADPPKCSSLDGITSGDGKACATCALRCDTPWALKADERRTKCLLSYVVMALNEADGSPMIIRTSGMSTRSVKDLISLLRFNHQINGEYHKVLIPVFSEKRVTPFGPAYALKFGMPKLITDEAKITNFKALSETLLGRNLLTQGSETQEPADDEIFDENGQLVKVSVEPSKVTESSKTAEPSNRKPITDKDF